MIRRLLVPLVVLLTLLAALRIAGDLDYWQRWLSARSATDAISAAVVVQPRLRVAGEPAALARSSPEGERIAAEALAVAESEARRMGLQALVVHRNGHRVFEYFAPAMQGDLLVAGGELSALPFALALGVLVDARRVDAQQALAAIRAAALPAASLGNLWSRETRERLNLVPAPPLLLQDADGDVADTLSQRVWLPLQAADAWLWGSGDDALRVDCCMVARLDDWMRVGDLLLGQGGYRGERIVSADWVRTLLDADRNDARHPVWLASQTPWHGDEPPVARDTFWFDLGSDLRLWLVPRRGLAVLVWGETDSRDTLIPNIILRGLLDQVPVAADAGLGDMVPGH